RAVPKTHALYDELDAVKQLLIVFASMMDIMQTQIDMAKRMFEIQNRVTGCPEIIRSYNRFLIAEFPVRFLNKNQHGFLFLFSDMVLFAESKSLGPVPFVESTIFSNIPKRDANLEFLTFRSIVQLEKKILRDCNDYEGSEKRGPDFDFIFTFENRSPGNETFSSSRNNSLSASGELQNRFLLEKTDGIEFCIKYRETRSELSKFIIPKGNLQNIFKEHEEHKVLKEFRPRTLHELHLRVGERCLIKFRSHWAQGQSLTTNRTGVFPLCILLPPCTESPDYLKSPGIYKVASNIQLPVSPPWPTSPTGIHPLHLPVKANDQILIQYHSFENHLLVYCSSFDLSDEGWFPLTRTITGIFRVREYCICEVIDSPRSYNAANNFKNQYIERNTVQLQTRQLAPGDLVNVLEIFGISLVIAELVRETGVKVRIHLLGRLEPLVLNLV
ncbi:hypothetical protein HK096_008951, partial [Nowakowskiella sp. JEL0078]